MNGDFYYTDKDVSKLTGISFPYPYEGNRGSYAEKLYSIAVSRFGFRTLSRWMGFLTYVLKTLKNKGF